MPLLYIQAPLKTLNTTAARSCQTAALSGVFEKPVLKQADDNVSLGDRTRQP